MSLLPLLAQTSISRTMYLLPLVAIISLVYSASRYESADRILRRAGKVTLQILGFMGVVLLVLMFLSAGL